MAGDRVIIVRFIGMGLVNDPGNPLTLTSRGTLPYLPAGTIEGVVSELSSTMSSDIAVFGTLGSDPSTQITILSTDITLSKMFSRGFTPLPDSDGATVLTTAYVTADPNPTIYVTDPTFISFGDLLRINGRVFEVGSVGVDNFTATYAWDCKPAPIPMQNVGGVFQGIPVGMVYNGGNEYPSGGAEQRAVIITTAPINATTAAQEKLLFTGTVSRVSLDTSAKAPNTILVDCQSMMGMVTKAPFSVPPAGLTFDGYLGGKYVDDGWFVDTTYISGIRAVIKSTPPQELVGELWDTAHTDYTTYVGKYQIRKGGYGGIMGIYGAVAQTGELTVASSLVDPDNNDIQLAGFQLVFNDGHYRNPETADRLDVDFANNPRNNRRDPNAIENQDMAAFRASINSEWVGEICFNSSTPATLIYDLIMGTVNANPGGSSGVRAAGMAAWLPFTGAIDIGSLVEAFDETLIRPDYPYLQVYDYYTDTTTEGWAVLPYVHDKVKTVGDVLEYILKKFGCYMVYDGGMFRFGRWSSVSAWPTKINDTGLAAPAIGTSFDRNNMLQTVTVEYPLNITADKATVTKNPIANIDNVQTGAGKSLTIGVIKKGAQAGSAGLTNSFSLTQGFDLITRYSQAAVVVDVAYLDSVYSLNVGDGVALSSAYMPNAQGTLGVTDATGTVLKAERNWMAGFTKYTIFLVNYLSSVERISMVACAAKVQAVSSPTDIKIEENIFTRTESRGGAPTSDAEAFAQTLAQSSSLYCYCMLCDEYGTPYPIPYEKLIVAVSDTLIFTGTGFSTAIPGDIIILAPATDQGAMDIAECYDAFQADSAGYVNAKLEFAYPWVR